jgi:hypothetical protein
MKNSLKMMRQRRKHDWASNEHLYSKIFSHGKSHFVGAYGQKSGLFT